MKIYIYFVFIPLFLVGCASSQVKSLEDRNAMLEARIEDLTNQINLVKQENARLLNEQRPQTNNNFEIRTPPQITTPITPPASSIDAESNRLYEQGRRQYESREYSAAIRTFTSVIERGQDSELVANSYYWIGESYYALGDYSAARLSFQRILDLYPNSGKLVDAKLKIAMTWLRQNDKATARTILQNIKRDHPNYASMNIVDQNLRLAR